MNFDKISGGIVLLFLAVAAGIAGVVLIRAEIWWLSPLGFPFVMWSCNATASIWKRVRP